MKLCQKCVDGIFNIYKENPHLILIKNKQAIVPESDCEFWAHVGLHGLHDQQVKTQQAYEDLLRGSNREVRAFLAEILQRHPGLTIGDILRKYDERFKT